MVYTLQDGNEDADCLHIVDLENNNAVAKVRNFGTDDAGTFSTSEFLIVKYISYNADLLYVATEHEIKICKVPPETFGSTLEPESQKIRTINPGLKIWGLLINKIAVDQKFVLVAYETEENVIDFNRLFIDNFDDDSYAFRYTQYREVVPRGGNWQNDPIKKAVFVFNNEGYNFSTVLRESRGIDIYWNMLKIESTERTTVIDIDMTPTSFFFKLQDNNTYGFDHNDKYTASFQQIMPINPDDLEWDNIKIQKIHKAAYIYKSIKLLALGGPDKGVD